jgi:hypothetical protein
LKDGKNSAWNKFIQYFWMNYIYLILYIKYINKY